MKNFIITEDSNGVIYCINVNQIAYFIDKVKEEKREIVLICHDSSNNQFCIHSIHQFNEIKNMIEEATKY